MLTKLKTETARRALTARKRFGFALDSPCDVYELISKYGLSLRFTNISSLDGLYLNDGMLGSINVSTLRPSGHQRFTAAHELATLFSDMARTSTKRLRIWKVIQPRRRSLTPSPVTS
jgi:hypothetical protein